MEPPSAHLRRQQRNPVRQRHQIGQEPLTGELVDDGGDLRIGGNSLWSEYFNGLIDEVRIYNASRPQPRSRPT